MSTLKVNTITNTSGNPDVANMGKIVQVVQNFSNGVTSTDNSSSYVDCLSSPSFTFTSGNKILVSMTGCCGSSATDNFGRGFFKVSVGGGSDTNIGDHFFIGNRMSHASKDISVWTHDYLYTTSSASAHTFKLGYRVIDGSNMSIGGWSHDSNWKHRTVCTLTEIVA